jgi:hypothetical protein
MILYQWATQWGVSLAAIKDLEARLGIAGPALVPATGLSEAAVQTNVRLEASRVGARLWRNNVGAFHDPESGSFVRFGLANESEQMNKVLKSSDLIGVRPVTITPQMVGFTFGQLVCRECKPGNWHYSGTDREVAQLNWINLINALGGDAAFASGEGTL